MAERVISAQDMGKSDDDQTMAHASQENQSDHGSDKILPIKKRWENQSDHTPLENTMPDQSERQGPGPNSSYVPKSPDGKDVAQNRTEPSHDAVQKVDDKQKEPEKTELTVDNIAQDNTISASTGFPYPELGPQEGQCLSKTLNCQDANPANPELGLDAYEVSILIDSPEIVVDPPVHLSMNLLVFDEYGGTYNMKLSQHNNGQWTFYTITEDWRIFVRFHNLKAGDEISFYRHFNSTFDDSYYTLKYVRKYSVPSKKNPVLIVKYNKASLEKNTPDEKNENAPAPGSSFSPDQGIHLQRPLTSIGVQENARPQSSYKVEDNEVPLENTSDRKKRKAQGPGSRDLTSEDYCLTKTLSSFEVVQENPKLYFHPYDAIILTGCRELIGYPLGTYSKDLLVYDVDDNEYTMNLSHHVNGWKIMFCLNTDWNSFLTTHNLNEGDELAFYRFLNPSVSKDYYYVLKCLRKPAEQSKNKPSDKIPQKNASVSPEHESEVEDSEVSLENAPDRKKRKVVGPGSRALTPADLCLSKTLSSLEVSEEDVRLYCDASSLSGSLGNVDYPLGKISKNLVVFDETDVQYDMLLSNFIHEGKIIYTFDAGWQRFVRAHDLKAGDEISVYRVRDKDSCEEYNYVIKYIRKS